MTILEAYKTFLIKSNKNDTNANVAIPKGVFVKIYNEQALVWLERQIRETNRNITKNHISNYLVYDYELEKLADQERYSEFIVPSDLFEPSHGITFAKKGKCGGRILRTYDFKSHNRNVLFRNSNTEPSFEYEETFFNLSNNKVLIFKKDFIIEKQLLTYYKSPIKIDIEGYRKEDGTQSINIDPDTDDKSVNEILNLCVIEVAKSFQDPNSLQFRQQQ